ncbi:MAG: 1-deoxy-D-xylulose-5-phosphate synthase [Bacteroidales bacterium]|nr:1-deoxy-D-xylulose-5-phosphate synthase [Candidatus Physcocola equi]
MSDSPEALLPHINSSDDLKKLSVEQLPQLCAELRQFIIDQLATNPGHFGASLGVVELTVALHYVYDTPDDSLVWDVGHQAYGHKILTGRREAFPTNRKLHGISGFPNPKESPYDAFIAGHASNSISAALGIAVGQALDHSPKRTVAIIGDGAMTGGLAFEGLNNASSSNNNLTIVLNDNHMAIDKVVGGLSNYLVKIHTSQTYNKMRAKVSRFLVDTGIIKEDDKAEYIKSLNSMKAFLTNQHNIFEGLNIRYFGPIDGHDVINLVNVFSDIKDFKGPKIVHIRTKKGKGFKPAEEFATEWHAPGKFDKVSGKRIIPEIKQDQPPLFQDVFGHTLLELARENKQIVGVTPAMATGCSMTYMMHEMPERTFDVGIAEGHAVTFSAGLAKQGKLPFCNIYSSFMQRALDNVIHDVALQNLHMVMCLDRAGLVGADGATHHGAFDLAYFRGVPNLTIASPLNELELRNLMFTAANDANGPFVIRYPRGAGSVADWHQQMKSMPIGKGYCLIPAEHELVAVLSVGPIGVVAQQAINELADEEKSGVALYNMVFVKPIDEEILRHVASRFKRIITIEDGTRMGGFGSAVLDAIADMDLAVPVKRIGLPDSFVEHGTPAELYNLLGMDKAGIQSVIKSELDKSKSSL